MGILHGYGDFTMDPLPVEEVATEESQLDLDTLTRPGTWKLRWVLSAVCAHSRNLQNIAEAHARICIPYRVGSSDSLERICNLQVCTSTESLAIRHRSTPLHMKKI